MQRSVEGVRGLQALGMGGGGGSCASRNAASQPPAASRPKLPPRLPRPAPHIAKGLLACGDYIQGPYPATLEGAVRSGLQAANLATNCPNSSKNNNNS